MTHYLIEFRFSGKAKKYLRGLMHDVSRKFNVHGATKNRAIPHITLVGPLTTRDESRLVRDLVTVAKKYDFIHFRMGDFGHFRGTGFFNWLLDRSKVIFVDINSSEQMNNLRLELVNAFKEYCTLNEHDFKLDRAFHATIAFKDINRKFNRILEYLQNHEPPKMRQLLLRITIIKNKKILYEYDLIQHRLLNRAQAKNPDIFRNTLALLKKHRTQG